MAKDNPQNVETLEYVHDDNLGDVKIADSVIAVCAINAVMKIRGVAGLTGGITDSITESLLGRESLSKGVKVKVTEEGVYVDLTLVLKYGYNIPDVSAKVQDKVKSEIENMTGLNVLEVNIRVASVSLETNN